MRRSRKMWPTIKKKTVDKIRLQTDAAVDATVTHEDLEQLIDTSNNLMEKMVLTNEHKGNLVEKRGCKTIEI